MSSISEKALDTLNRVAKWRSILAGWQLGTRSKEDPEAQAVRDHREATIMLRVELNTITALLLRKKVFTEDEFYKQLIEDANHLDEQFKERFPGAESTPLGMKIDHRAKDWLKDWRP